MSEIFLQGDKRWANQKLGESSFTMEHFGCTTTAVAQSLADAGWDFTPGTLNEQLNKIGGYTNKSHPAGPGLLIWAKVSELCSGFQFNTGGDLYQENIVCYRRGLQGKMQHWVLQRDPNTVVDPLTGHVGGFPTGFEPLPFGSWVCTVHKAPQEHPAPAPAPTPEPAPEQDLSEEPKLPSVVVKEGDTLGDLVLAHYGDSVADKLWGKKGVVATVAIHNAIENPEIIKPGDVIQFPNL